MWLNFQLKIQVEGDISSVGVREAEWLPSHVVSKYWQNVYFCFVTKHVFDRQIDRITIFNTALA